MRKTVETVEAGAAPNGTSLKRGVTEKGQFRDLHRRAYLLVISAVALLASAVCFDAAEGGDRELIRDPGFRDGFTVLQPEPGKRVPYGVLRGPEAAAAPVWDLDQWSSKQPLAIAAPARLADGSLCYAWLARV